ncbi:quinone-dependent dihydroorotate dehydrogenase [Sphingomonas arenae]|uniref:quinone-dependent dihydroorotate dehydrogenase n=1 Tax=Sphingomonas arenae TaxID=2812555 RepID=UPI0019672662|nr:quinone-dependent dihydroorotate dehydrogenase [Sphingomonas arenae]
MALYPLLRPLILRLDAEKAHQVTIASLKAMPKRKAPSSPTALAVEVAGLRFPNPVGLAAGFDKDAEVPDAMLALGFGFVEVGTLTPRPQHGNPRPRLFRLPEDQAVINRFGFNNQGQEDALQRLRGRRRAGVLGVNIGANKDSPDRVADYAEGVRRMSEVADYLTINISSPNTPGLRQLQDEGALRELLAAVRDARSPDGPPVFLKVAPDLGQEEPRQIVRAALDHGVDALIVSNTTISRPPLRSSHGGEAGGLSGAPLKPLALDALRRFRAASGGQLPLVGAGGIASAEDAWQRIRAGASLVQLYSAMVYEGPGIARRIAEGLAVELERAGFSSIAEAVGTE